MTFRFMKRLFEATILFRNTISYGIVDLAWLKSCRLQTGVVFWKNESRGEASIDLRLLGIGFSIWWDYSHIKQDEDDIFRDPV